ncbi:uncharacterized protein LOC141544634 [Sminthopsis crassicaudata]|uniref:uncharacterized protein LOC141544634 n=1 Tax=Sminthopsis crassicaudata TaxID=9301 RepID=UPI003D692E9A
MEKKKHVLVDNNTGKQTTSETPNIPNQLQVHSTSEKCAVRKGLDKEDDTESPWNSEEYITEPDGDRKKNDILTGNDTGLDKEKDTESPWDSEEYITEPDGDRKKNDILTGNDTGLDKEKDTESPWDSEEYITEPAGDRKKNDILTGNDTGLDKEKDTESPWDSEPSSENLLEGSAKHILAATNQNIKESILIGQREDASRSDFVSNSQKIECPTSYKNVGYSRYYPCQSLTKSRNEEVSTEKIKIHLKENDTDEAAADPRSGPDTGSKVGVVLQKVVPRKQSEPSVQKEETRKQKKDASRSDSVSNSQKSECPKSSKDVGYSRNYPCQSLPKTRNQEVSIEMVKIHLKENEATKAAADTRSGPDTGSKVGVVLQKVVPRKQSDLPVEKEEDRKQKKDASRKDSVSNSQKSKHPSSSKHARFSSNYPCQSLPKTRNQGVSTEMVKNHLKGYEAAETAADTRRGPDTGSEIGVAWEKPVPSKQSEPSVQKEETRKQKKDASRKDSVSNSQKSKHPSSSKHVRFSSNYPCQSLPKTRNQGVSTEMVKNHLKGYEAAEPAADTRRGPDTGSEIGVAWEKPVPSKQSEPPVQKEEARKQKKDASRSDFVSNSQKSKHPSRSKNVGFSSNYPCQSLPKTRNQGVSTEMVKIHLKGNEAAESAVDTRSGPDTGSNVTVVLQKAFSKEESELLIICYIAMLIGIDASRRDSVSNSQKSECPTSSKDVGYSRYYPCQSLPKTRNQGVSTEMVKILLKENYTAEAAANTRSGPDTGSKVGVVLQKPVPRKRSEPPVQNKKDRIQKKDLKKELKLKGTSDRSQEILNKSDHKQPKNDKPEVECTCNINEEDIAYDAKNIQRADSKIAINEMKEDEIIQEKKPELYAARKCKEKTKHKEPLFENNHHSASNSTNESRHQRYSLPHRIKISKMHLDKELKQDTQRLKYEFGILQAESLTFEREKIPPQKKVEEEKQKHLHNEIETLERKHGDKSTENKVNGMEIHQHGKDEENKIPEEEIPITCISSKENLAPVHHVLKGLEGEKQNREEPQSEMNYLSSVSSAVLDHQLQLSNLIFQQERDEWLLLKDKIVDKNDFLSVQVSKGEDEHHRLSDSLRKKTLILEKLQRELKQLMKKLKALKKLHHIQEEKLNRSIFKQESKQERLAQMQKEIKQHQKLFEDAQNKDVLKVVVSNGIIVQLRDNSMTLYANTEKQDCVAEEKNKKLIDHYIHVKEQLHKFENEKAERKNTIRKLQEELADFRREKSSTLNLGLSLYQKMSDIKQRLKKIDYTTNKLLELQEQNKQKQRYINELEDGIPKCSSWKNL